MVLKTTIKLYNTATKKKEEFTPLHGSEVRMYSCGPTVYDEAHIGNLRAYVFDDVLYRFLSSVSYEVKWVMNITDIDDKTLNRAKKEGKTLSEITEKYFKIFLDDLKKINVSVSSIKFVKATEHFSEMREMVDALIEKGFAYETDDGVYFDVSKFENYGNFAGVEVDENRSQSRIESDAYDKESVQDFALWKKDDAYLDGRPGWHIECSAMAGKYLGLPFDIHTGGVDLVFPHHTNEIAQTKAATGKDLAKFWLHNEHLLVNGEKMAKSKNNFYTLRDIVEKGFSPMVLRFELLKAHYRSKLDFSWEDMKGSKKVLQDMRRFWTRCGLVKDSQVDLDAQYREFMAALADDLNVPAALAVVHTVINNDDNLGLGGRDFLKKVDDVLGLGVAEDVPDSVASLLKEMDMAREKGDYEESDRLRENIEKQGYIIENSKEGSYVVNRG